MEFNKAKIVSYSKMEQDGKELNLLDNYGQEDTTGIGNIEEGDREGLVGDRDEQEEND